MTGGLRWTPEVYAAHLAKERLRPPAPAGDVLHLILPWPPSVNHCGADGRRYGRKSVAYNEFMSEVSLRYTGRRIEGRLRVDIVLVPPSRRKYDIDNRVKATLDALQACAIFDDDEQVDKLTVERAPAEEVPDGRGSAIVTISRILQ